MLISIDSSPHTLSSMSSFVVIGSVVLNQGRFELSLQQRPSEPVHCCPAHITSLGKNKPCCSMLGADSQ